MVIKGLNGTADFRGYCIQINFIFLVGSDFDRNWKPQKAQKIVSLRYNNYTFYSQVPTTLGRCQNG